MHVTNTLMARMLCMLSIVFTVFQTTVGQPYQSISEKEVTEILEKLSADDMGGRQAFGPYIGKAASYIADHFQSSGLKTQTISGSFLQEFEMIRSNIKKPGTAKVGNLEVPLEKIICQTANQKLNITPASPFEVIRIKEGDNAMTAMRNLRNKTGNLLVLMHEKNEPFFNRIKQNSSPRMKNAGSVVYVLTPDVDATEYELELRLEVETIKMANVVGVLPGKGKPNEYVIFSGHYDHIGVGKPNEQGDSIYNGANDDASGVTAVMMLGKHFAKVGGNERTLVFVAFTAEEVGGYGSQYFSKQMDPESVKAMFNIEMIGTDSKWGKNSAFITGYEKTDMGQILQKNLENSPFKFYPDPYPEQQLFYRSDNATLARLGVPAHTVSTSKMDIEPHYHRPSDEVSTLDIRNMTEIIRAILVSSTSIVQGIDTPSRVNTNTLR